MKGDIIVYCYNNLYNKIFPNEIDYLFNLLLVNVLSHSYCIAIGFLSRSRIKKAKQFVISRKHMEFRLRFIIDVRVILMKCFIKSLFE